MLHKLPNLTVINQIPQEAIWGLLTNQLTIYGGIIRHAKGTIKAGQIAYHLAPAIMGTVTSPIQPILELVNTYQLSQLSTIQKQLVDKVSKLATQEQLTSVIKQLTTHTHQLDDISNQAKNITLITKNVLNLTTGTMLFSGLNISLSAIGFMALNQRVKSFENYLLQLRTEIKAVRSFLEIQERSALTASLKTLEEIDNITDLESRRLILTQERQTIAQINEKYRELLAKTAQLEEAMCQEEYFIITALAHARCYAELGELAMAQKILVQAKDFWTIQSRRIAKDLLIKDNPQRFVSKDYIEETSLATVTSWLDFAYQKEDGYSWLEELRGKPEVKLWFTQKQISQDKKWVIPSLQRLTQRDKVLEGYLSQYDWFAKYKIKPSEFNQETAKIQEITEGYIILEAID